MRKHGEHPPGVTHSSHWRQLALLVLPGAALQVATN